MVRRAAGPWEIWGKVQTRRANKHPVLKQKPGWFVRRTERPHGQKLRLEREAAPGLIGFFLMVENLDFILDGSEAT